MKNLSLRLATLSMPIISILSMNSAIAGSFADRNNELVVADDSVGRAMVRIGGGSGMQVCPGVFLTNAHVVYQNDSSGPTSPTATILPYSFTGGEEYHWQGGLRALEMEIIDSNPFSSDHHLGTDYVFLRTSPDVVNNTFRSLGSDIRSFDYVPLLNLDGSLLASLTQTGDIEAHFYRLGYPNQDNRLATFPRRTVEACQIAPMHEHNFGFDCPAGGGISGSSLITHIQDQPFVVGLFWGGAITDVWSADTFTQSINRHLAIETSHMCSDYERACGRPCVQPSGIAKMNIEDDRNAVVELQGFLNEQGFDAGPVDGLYGRRTGAALNDFLATTGSETDGFTVEVHQLIRSTSN